MCTSFFLGRSRPRFDTILISSFLFLVVGVDDVIANVAAGAADVIASVAAGVADIIVSVAGIGADVIANVAAGCADLFATGAADAFAKSGSDTSDGTESFGCGSSQVLLLFCTLNIYGCSDILTLNQDV